MSRVLAWGRLCAVSSIDAAEGDFPVQNPKAEFSLTVTATFPPDCTPPMTLAFTNVVVSDAEHDLSETFPGPF